MSDNKNELPTRAACLKIVQRLSMIITSSDINLDRPETIAVATEVFNFTSLLENAYAMSGVLRQVAESCVAIVTSEITKTGTTTDTMRGVFGQLVNMDGLMTKSICGFVNTAPCLEFAARDGNLESVTKIVSDATGPYERFRTGLITLVRNEAANLGLNADCLQEVLNKCKPPVLPGERVLTMARAANTL